MARRRGNSGGNNIEDVVKLVLAIVAFIAFSIGGVNGFFQAFVGLMQFTLLSILSLLGLGVGYLVIRFLIRHYQHGPQSPSYNYVPPSSRPAPTAARRNVVIGENGTPKPAYAPPRPVVTLRPEPPPRPKPPAWTAESIEKALSEIDWYQFEKFSAALLTSDGYQVERRGGAQPDGGVDLIATRYSTPMLVQCKHWRTWTLQERVVREMLGSMSHFGVRHGAIYTLKGWTKPAGAFAEQHQISLANAATLAELAFRQLSNEHLDELLKSRNHHCPKCESIMVWREGDFTPFWGCPRYPRCRGKLNHSGAR